MIARSEARVGQAEGIESHDMFGVAADEKVETILGMWSGVLLYAIVIESTVYFVISVLVGIIQMWGARRAKAVHYFILPIVAALYAVSVGFVVQAVPTLAYSELSRSMYGWELALWGACQGALFLLWSIGAFRTVI